MNLSHALPPVRDYQPVRHLDRRATADKERPRLFDAKSALGLDRGETGRSLEPAVRATMESRLGHDFGRVRVHTGERAASSTSSLRANAFTSGRDLAFASGRYAPQTPRGSELLAHELHHVVQQESMPDAGRGRWVQLDDATTSAVAPPTDIHIPIGRSRFTIMPGDGPLRLKGQKLPLPGSLRLTNAFGVGPGPTFVADLDPRQLVVHLLDAVDLQTTTLAGTPPGHERDFANQATLRLVNPTAKLDFSSGRLAGWATLHVPSAYPPQYHPGTDVAIQVESEPWNPSRWTATASYGPLVANAKIRLHYDLGRLARATGAGLGELETELTHPGLSVRGGLRLGIPLTTFSLEAPTTRPLPHPLLGAPTKFPASYMAGGVIVAPPGSITSVAAPALGVTGASYGERRGLSGTVALLPSLSPEAISLKQPLSKQFFVLGYAEVVYVTRVSEGLDLGVRAVIQVNSADLLGPSKGLEPPPPGPPRQEPILDPRHPPAPELPQPISPYGGISIIGRFNGL